MRVLGIETSCDETAVAVYDSQRGLLAHGLYSQASMHAEYGGVVPELASRDHIRMIIPTVRRVLHDSRSKPSDIDAIAYTAGPGLIGALLVGASTARSLAWAWNIPAIPVHHMEAHMLAVFLEEAPPNFPFVALLVSGGHTLLIRVGGLGSYSVLGESIDDAAGEAFDKTAKLMGLGYPGGPAISRLAERGCADRFTFPKPMTERAGLNFSFSGLKTHTALALSQTQQSDQDKADIALAFEIAIASTIRIKCERALGESGLRTLVAAGGVSANRRIRQELAQMADETGCRVYFPRLEFCTDNGAMVAVTGFLKLSTDASTHSEILVRPRWPLDELIAQP